MRVSPFLLYTNSIYLNVQNVLHKVINRLQGMSSLPGFYGRVSIDDALDAINIWNSSLGTIKNIVIIYIIINNNKDY